MVAHSHKNSHRNALEHAAERAAAHDQRWTEMRQAVFGLMIDQTKPVTAYQIIDHLSQKLQKDIKPASVYRALEALSTLGLVVKIESLNAFIACAHPDDHHQHVFLVCRQCGTADELAEHAISKRLSTEAIHQGFKIERQVLELQGACRTCQM